MSKFYLKHFADTDEMLTVIELPGRSFSQSIKNASVHNDFYTALNNEGEATDIAEVAFSEIEGPAANAWRAADDGMWPLTDEDRAAMAGWIGLQLLRTTRVRQTLNDLGTGLLNLEIVMGGRARLREALRDSGDPYDDESVDREWIDLHRDPLRIVVNANHHLTYLASALPEVVEHLLTRCWVLTAFARKTLGTSDNPVAVVPNQRDTALGLGTGIVTADVIALPLTRRLGLAMARRDSLGSEQVALADVRQDGTAMTALWGNSVTSLHARRFLFHHPADEPFKGLDLPEPRVRELGGSHDPWAWMQPDDRKVLIDAGVEPPGVELDP